MITSYMVKIFLYLLALVKVILCRCCEWHVVASAAMEWKN